MNKTYTYRNKLEFEKGIKKMQMAAYPVTGLCQIGVTHHYIPKPESDESFPAQTDWCSPTPLEWGLPAPIEGGVWSILRLPHQHQKGVNSMSFLPL